MTLTGLGLSHGKYIVFFNFHDRLIRSDILVGVRWIALSNWGMRKAFISLLYSKLLPGKRKRNQNEGFFFIWGGTRCFMIVSQPTACCKGWWDNWWSADDLEECGIQLMALLACYLSMVTIENRDQNGHHMAKIRSPSYKYTVSSLHQLFRWFLGRGWPFSKIEKSDYRVRHACLSVRLCLIVHPPARTEQRYPQWKDFHKILFSSFFLPKIKSVEKVQNSFKSDKNNE